MTQQELQREAMTSTRYVTRWRRRRRTVMLGLALSVVGVVSWRAVDALAPARSASSGHVGGWASVAWPAEGAAAVAVGSGRVHAAGSVQPVPIASLAKVMTALVVLRSRPISAHDPGFTITITSEDDVDTERRRLDGESVVPVAVGEMLTEHQALQALLLPSANNIAMALARAVSGSTDAFVDEMNAEARRLAMTATVYTDPSGFDPGTVSTAGDQLLLARAAMRIDAFAQIVAEPAATIPEAGPIYNTNALVGHDGFIGIKTGSDQAAGGCFMFAARVPARHAVVYGVVLGQRGGPLIAAGLDAGRRLADSVPAGSGAR